MVSSGHSLSGPAGSRGDSGDPALAVSQVALWKGILYDAAALHEAVVDLGRVQVDIAGHRLLRDGDALPVKPKAFDLLVFLLRHPGQVFTRDQLLERVWGYDYAGETRTVDVHVHWLRSQIEEEPSSPRFIHTVRGVGYGFRRSA
jgi:two-component system alkaline phosphatase synthesis response regulator PhoP